MASGDPVVQVLRVMPPGATSATMDARAGGSTPAEAVIVYDFDAAAAEYMDFLCRLEGYDGGGITLTLPYSMSSATADDVIWTVAVRAMPDDAEDIDASHTYVYNSVTDTVPSASGELSYPTVAFTNGADMDSWADGELAIVRVSRDATNESDTATGDAELWGISGVES